MLVVYNSLSEDRKKKIWDCIYYFILSLYGHLYECCEYVANGSEIHSVTSAKHRFYEKDGMLVFPMG